ncbi:hypothetical protein F4823DRAFT_565578 [Ustulina deusta]|nr:hypothetical protein F4823DRAFT_565578 [Ustulina deusta]
MTLGFQWLCHIYGLLIAGLWEEAVCDEDRGGALYTTLLAVLFFCQATNALVISSSYALSSTTAEGFCSPNRLACSEKRSEALTWDCTPACRKGRQKRIDHGLIWASGR